MNADIGTSLNSAADLILGSGQEIVISRIDTEKVSVSNVFTNKSAPTRVAQTFTVVELNYSKGYLITLGLIGDFVLSNENPDIFTNASALITAIEKADFHFELQGTFFGFEESDVFTVPASQFKELDRAFNSLWVGEGYDALMDELLETITKRINSKEFVLADEIISKTKQSAIDFLKTNSL